MFTSANIPYNDQPEAIMITTAKIPICLQKTIFTTAKSHNDDNSEKASKMITAKIPNNDFIMMTTAKSPNDDFSKSLNDNCSKKGAMMTEAKSLYDRSKKPK